MNNNSAYGQNINPAMPYAMIIIAAVILASNHIVARYMSGVIPPMGMVFWRIVIGACVLLPFAGMGLFANRTLIFKHWKLFLILGVLFVPLGNGIIYAAYNFTTALNGGVVSASQPAITVILSWLMFRDLINWKQGVGILIAASGVLAIISRGDPASLLLLQFNIGDLMMIVATGFVALHNVLLRLVPQEINTPQLLLAIQLFGLLIGAPLYLAETLFYRPVPISLEAIGVLLWIGIAVTTIAVGLTNTAVRIIGANKASMANYLRAGFTAILAIMLLGETFQPFHAVGLALVIGGVLRMSRGRRRLLLPETRRAAPLSTVSRRKTRHVE